MPCHRMCLSRDQGASQVSVPDTNGNAMSDVPETKTLADPIVFLICFATHEIHAMGSGETIPQRLHLDGSSQADMVRES